MEKNKVRSSLRLAAVVALFGTAAGLFFTVAHASGISEPTYDFVTPFSTDVMLDRFETGDLGVVLPTYGRIPLYAAWRAVVLGRQGTKANIPQPGGLARLIKLNVTRGWTASDPDELKAWVAASAAFTSSPRTQLSTDCAPSAFLLATSTLATLQSRADATEERARTWVQTQDEIFSHCEAGDPDIPQELPESEPRYYRQLREYQIAAAYFYNGRYEDSRLRFQRIAADQSHPMRAWGAYLALRSLAREISRNADTSPESIALREQIAALEKKPNPHSEADSQKSIAMQKELFNRGEAWGASQMKTLNPEGAAILETSEFSSVHTATRELLRIMQSRLAPGQRFQELSRLLEDPTRDPYADDYLNDWRFFQDYVTGYQPPDSSADQSKRSEFADWIDTVQGCTAPVSSDAITQCQPQFDHAIERWKAPVTAGDPLADGKRRAWILAALMQATALPPDLENAALKVEPDAPEYLTVRYNLVRLYRSLGRQNEARQIGQSELASGRTQLSISANNLFRQERFSVATSIDDAAGYVLRQMARYRNPDTAESEPVSPLFTNSMDGDGSTWLNRNLSIADMAKLGQDERLGPKVQARILTAAWIRADLIGSAQQAQAIAKLVFQRVPDVAEDAQRYLRASGVSAKRHALIISMLRLRLSPIVDSWNGATIFGLPPSSPGDTTASMWCSLARDDLKLEQSTVWPPPPLEIGSTAPSVSRELSALAKLKTATGFVGDHVMQWAKTHPNDPDLPWLLHVVVQSTRGGCLNDGATQLSRAAFILLHTRYKYSDWAKQTPYWFSAR